MTRKIFPVICLKHSALRVSSRSGLRGGKVNTGGNVLDRVCRAYDFHGRRRDRRRLAGSTARSRMGVLGGLLWVIIEYGLYLLVGYTVICSDMPVYERTKGGPLSEDPKTWPISDLRVVETMDFIRSHSSMFLGVERPTDALLTNQIIAGAILLTDQRVVTCRHGGWRMIAAEEDWLAPARISDSRSVFEHIVPFLEAGVNSCHPEVLLSAFADHVVTATAEIWMSIRGVSMEPDTMEWAKDRLPRWRRLVAFRIESANDREMSFTVPIGPYDFQIS